MVESVLTRLKGENIRSTPQRRAVIRALLELEDQHPRAEEIYSQALEYYQGLGLSTVYRTLSLLEEMDIVLALDLGREMRYELRMGSNHQHAFCLSCGEVLEIMEGQDQISFPYLREKGFQAVETSVVIFGYCQECNQRGSSGKERKYNGSGTGG